MTFTAFTRNELRSAFATRVGTPDAVVAQRAAAARRLRVGIFSPRSLAIRELYLEAEIRDAEIDAAATRWFAENQHTFTYIVGVNHDTPVAAYLDGAANVRLCLDPGCCDGVLETFEQREQRLAAWAKNPGLETAHRDIFPTLDDVDDMHYLGVVSGLS